MSAAPEERLARNEAFFREVNERIRQVATGFNGEGQEFLCECSDPTCAVRISLTLEEYEHIRASSTRFVLAPGHIANEIEHVLEHEGDHVVVEKRGVAGEVASTLDPRAAG
jgi:hypothetical protein